MQLFFTDTYGTWGQELRFVITATRVKLPALSSQYDKSNARKNVKTKARETT